MVNNTSGTRLFIQERNKSKSKAPAQDPSMPLLEFNTVGNQITEYAEAALAVHVLNQKVAGEAVSVEVAGELLAFQNLQQPPNMLALIDDLVNVQKKAIPGTDMVVTVGNDVFLVSVKTSHDNEAEVQITQKVAQDANQQLAFVDESRPIVTIKRGGKQFEAKIEGKVVFTERSLTLKALPRDVIEQFGKKVREGKPQQIAIMGTGSGKSMVIAGIAHATHPIVMVVPDDELYKEMKTGAIKKLQGEIAAEKVHSSKEYKTVKEFQKAIQEGVLMVLVANDPKFHTKAESLKNTIILMDESHQYTFNEESRQSLTHMKKNNVLLALTGTPTSKLKDIVNDKTLVDVNVRLVMDSGALRQNYRQTNDNIPTNELVKSTVFGYFARDEYLIRGPGVMSIGEMKRKILSGQSEAEVINSAIVKNLERGVTHKNFVFSGDDDLRADIIRTYEQIAAGTYADINALQQAVALDRKEKEINARFEILHQLHPELEAKDIASEVRSICGDTLPPVNLQTEIQLAQQQQIADSINANALALVYNASSLANGNKAIFEVCDFEKQIRMGTVENFILEQKANITPMVPDLKNINAVAKGLPTEQRAVYMAQVEKVMRKLLAAENKTPLCTAKDIDLQKMQAEYCASATTQTNEKESEMILDRLTTGLVMHVASDQKYTTGISINSVLSVQQVIAEEDDSLNNPLDAPQLHGRNIREKDRGAFNQQVVGENVKHYVSLESIYSKTSGEEIEAFFQYERDKKEQKVLELMKKYAGNVSKKDQKQFKQNLHKFIDIVEERKSTSIKHGK